MFSTLAQTAVFFGVPDTIKLLCLLGATVVPANFSYEARTQETVNITQLRRELITWAMEEVQESHAYLGLV